MNPTEGPCVKGGTQHLWEFARSVEKAHVRRCLWCEQVETKPYGSKDPWIVHKGGKSGTDS